MSTPITSPPLPRSTPPVVWPSARAGMQVAATQQARREEASGSGVTDYGMIITARDVDELGWTDSVRSPTWPPRRDYLSVLPGGPNLGVLAGIGVGVLLPDHASVAKTVRGPGEGAPVASRMGINLRRWFADSVTHSYEPTRRRTRTVDDPLTRNARPMPNRHGQRPPCRRRRDQTTRSRSARSRNGGALHVSPAVSADPCGGMEVVDVIPTFPRYYTRYRAVLLRRR